MSKSKKVIFSLAMATFMLVGSLAYFTDRFSDKTTLTAARLTLEASISDEGNKLLPGETELRTIEIKNTGNINMESRVSVHMEATDSTIFGDNVELSLEDTSKTKVFEHTITYDTPTIAPEGTESVSLGLSLDSIATNALQDKAINIYILVEGRQHMTDNNESDWETVKKQEIKIGNKDALVVPKDDEGAPVAPSTFTVQFNTASLNVDVDPIVIPMESAIVRLPEVAGIAYWRNADNFDNPIKAGTRVQVTKDTTYTVAQVLNIEVSPVVREGSPAQGLGTFYQHFAGEFNGALNYRKTLLFDDREGNFNMPSELLNYTNHPAYDSVKIVTDTGVDLTGKSTILSSEIPNAKSIKVVGENPKTFTYKVWGSKAAAESKVGQPQETITFVWGEEVYAPYMVQQEWETLRSPVLGNTKSVLSTGGYGSLGLVPENLDLYYSN